LSVTIIRYPHIRMIGNQNNREKKVFGSTKTKGPKQDTPNRLWSPKYEGGEPYLKKK
jgi:hypothetical protein